MPQLAVGARECEEVGQVFPVRCEDQVEALQVSSLYLAGASFDHDPACCPRLPHAGGPVGGRYGSRWCRRSRSLGFFSRVFPLVKVRSRTLPVQQHLDVESADLALHVLAPHRIGRRDLEIDGNRFDLHGWAFTPDAGSDRFKMVGSGSFFNRGGGVVCVGGVRVQGLGGEFFLPTTDTNGHE